MCTHAAVEYKCFQVRRACPSIPIGTVGRSSDAAMVYFFSRASEDISGESTSVLFPTKFTKFTGGGGLVPSDYLRGSSVYTVSVAGLFSSYGKVLRASTPAI